MADIGAELAPRLDHEDTPIQANVRACFVTVLEGLPPRDLVGATLQCITLLQGQLLPALGDLRRQAARTALYDGMSVKELALYTGDTPTTIARLSSEAGRMDRWEVPPS